MLISIRGNTKNVPLLNPMSPCVNHSPSPTDQDSELGWWWQQTQTLHSSFKNQHRLYLHLIMVNLHHMPLLPFNTRGWNTATTTQWCEQLLSISKSSLQHFAHTDTDCYWDTNLHLSSEAEAPNEALPLALREAESFESRCNSMNDSTINAHLILGYLCLEPENC